MVMVIFLFVLCFASYRNAPDLGNGLKGVAVTVNEIKREMQTFKSAYQLKLDFSMVGSPDELLKALQNKKLRSLWDHNMVSMTANDVNGTLKVEYKSADASFPGFTEEVRIEYMMKDGLFYIIEQVSTSVMGKYERVWIMRQVVNRPYRTQVTLLATISHVYHRTRNNCLSLIHSVSALKNLIEMTDREQEMHKTG